MVFNSRIRAIMFSAIILIMGVIHFAVGIGIVTRYKRFGDVFQQQVGLSGYSIFIGIFTIIIGILGLIASIGEYKLLGKITAIISIIVGILTFASFIAALALSGQAATYFRDTITDYMTDYIQDDDAIEVMNDLQSTYECCGVNLWLDWSRVQLGTANPITIGRRRREEQSSLPMSPLLRAIRKKRQIITPGSNLYNLPTSFSVNLPLSCCRDGGTSSGNSLGGYCIFNAYNGTSSFYVRGCLEPAANIGFSQITGIAVINTALTILAFVYFAKLYNFCHNIEDTVEKQSVQSVTPPPYQPEQFVENSYGPFYGINKLTGATQVTSPQQNPYGQYYGNNYNPNAPVPMYDNVAYHTYH